MVTDSGLWIKDEINENTLIIKSNFIKGNILHKTIINEFDNDFSLIRTIQSEKINIKDNYWIIYNPTITRDNITKEDTTSIISKQILTRIKLILFSNITTLNIINLFTLKKEYEKLDIHLTKFYIKFLNSLQHHYFMEYYQFIGNYNV